MEVIRCITLVVLWSLCGVNFYLVYENYRLRKNWEHQNEKLNRIIKEYEESIYEWKNGRSG